MCRTEERPTRLAVMGIMIEDRSCTAEVNRLLSEYGQYIAGRMGLPYEKKQIHIISVVLDAPQDQISALSGKLGRMKGASVQVMYSKKGQKTDLKGEGL